MQKWSERDRQKLKDEATSKRLEAIRRELGDVALKDQDDQDGQAKKLAEDM